MVPLTDLNVGSAGLVRALNGGHTFIARLAVLGFTPGATVIVMRNHRTGPLIVSIRGTQIALGRGEAKRILVHPANGQTPLTDGIQGM
jgi:ferrous iron transport protein A